LEQLSFADNYYVNDEDLHMLYDLETLHSLDFSGCPQVEDSGISVRTFPPLCPAREQTRDGRSTCSGICIR